MSPHSWIMNATSEEAHVNLAKKKEGVFQVTWPENIGSVGRIFLIFFTFYFYFLQLLKSTLKLTQKNPKRGKFSKEIVNQKLTQKSVKIQKFLQNCIKKSRVGPVLIGSVG